MGYYRGDYYRGDYYRGDFLGLGKAFKSVTGFVSKLGIPVVSQVAGAVNQVITPHKSLPRPQITPEIMAFNNVASGNVPDVDVPGGNYPVSVSGGNNIPAFQNTNVPTRGYHYNKSTYETRGGGTSRWGTGLQLHKKGTVLVRNRRMNVGNAKALKRALRRAGGFARLARRVMSFTHPRAGRGRFKVGKRARR